MLHASLVPQHLCKCDGIGPCLSVCVCLTACSTLLCDSQGNTCFWHCSTTERHISRTPLLSSFSCMEHLPPSSLCGLWPLWSSFSCTEHLPPPSLCGLRGNIGASYCRRRRPCSIRQQWLASVPSRLVLIVAITPGTLEATGSDDSLANQTMRHV